jgi:hypothetical protein
MEGDEDQWSPDRLQGVLHPAVLAAAPVLRWYLQVGPPQYEPLLLLLPASRQPSLIRYF